MVGIHAGREIIGMRNFCFQLLLYVTTEFQGLHVCTKSTVSVVTKILIFKTLMHSRCKPRVERWNSSGQNHVFLHADCARLSTTKCFSHTFKNQKLVPLCLFGIKYRSGKQRNLDGFERHQSADCANEKTLIFFHKLLSIRNYQNRIWFIKISGIHLRMPVPPTFSGKMITFLQS